MSALITAPIARFDCRQHTEPMANHQASNHRAAPCAEPTAHRQISGRSAAADSEASR
ncbi:hypothetical protein Caci_1542 [Catenulispora acidiphila DSM 44928]|uniref:Uncharacterized protein n=1 Tax=Catenulispora acidiphila (strain DSM 44928 / JCM 14897 / NBRC 102108 / NRRL B-24433 / ID139908) TaxID=479433 RepID=C7QA65_CATAD|nr:hypothetical protein [Catenulispora acidiphila]ACU70463.1 hypothetical protein Caci_1542 [Catenulispora acidiphila DSM 44928]